jgi:hypothetical protein
MNQEQKSDQDRQKALSGLMETIVNSSEFMGLGRAPDGTMARLGRDSVNLELANAVEHES